MAQMTIRNLDSGVYARLKARAARHHRSLEAEARLILAEATTLDRQTLAAWAAELRRRQQGRWTERAVALIRADRRR